MLKATVHIFCSDIWDIFNKWYYKKKLLLDVAFFFLPGHVLMLTVPCCFLKINLCRDLLQQIFH